MPRRRALTEAQLDVLFALPVTEADLIRHWTVDGADLAVVYRRRGASNQLGYALQLYAFHYPGRLLRPGPPLPPVRSRPFMSNCAGTAVLAFCVPDSLAMGHLLISADQLATWVLLQIWQRSQDLRPKSRPNTPLKRA